MINAFRTKDGDILPFHQVIRVMKMNETVRILFVNGAVDLLYKEGEAFIRKFEEWLGVQYRYPL